MVAPPVPATMATSIGPISSAAGKSMASSATPSAAAKMISSSHCESVGSFANGPGDGTGGEAIAPF